MTGTTTKDQTHILVFRTNISTEADKHLVKETLANPFIDDWSVDTEDVDCVLRVVTRKLSPEDVVEMITQKGYTCSEME